MAKLAGRITDSETGETVSARVNVTDATGKFLHPIDSLLKIGPGTSFFYSSGSFEIDVPRGRVRVIVERGTEYIPIRLDIEASSQGTVTADVQLKRWSKLGTEGWHPGNTHIHYDEKEKRPDDRLHLDPRVEDLRMTAVSILKRWDLEYASNKYSPGLMTDFTSAHHYVQCGEESRHNAEGSHSPGYGHIMLLNIKNVVEPVSRGLLVDAFDPDYPPLSYACDDTHRQGGIVIWCHNGRGMEAPVAAALGKLDAFNLFDPHWMDPEYDIYYKMLNAGIRLPASTGSDWFISSGNRVYAYTGEDFEYEPWLAALKQGRTFITNGPSLSLSIQGEKPGAEIEARPGESLPSLVTWQSHYPVSHVELLFNGDVIVRKTLQVEMSTGSLEADIPARCDGWVAARLWSTARDSFAQPIFAHTSPIYLKTGLEGPEKIAAAAYFNQAIDESLKWVGTKGKFYTDNQRREVVDLFREGQQVYKRIIH